MKSNHPTCPHCSYELTSEQTWDDYPLIGDIGKDDGDLSQLTCPSCYKPFHVTCVHTLHFETCDEDGDAL